MFDNLPFKLNVKVGYHHKNTPYPAHDFSKFKDYEVLNRPGLIASNSTDLKQQIDSKHRLDPNAETVRYFYYEVA